MPHVLVVDDDVDVLETVRRMVERLGCSVEAVNGGDSFMKAVIRRKPDIAIIDVVMPDIDGIELVRWLGDIACDASVVVMSGGGHARCRSMAAAIAGAGSSLTVTTLAKPFKLSKLSAALFPPPAGIAA